jgi:gas vesicle protein
MVTAWEEEISPTLTTLGTKFSLFATEVGIAWDKVSTNVGAFKDFIVDDVAPVVEGAWLRIKTAAIEAWEKIDEAITNAKKILEEAGITFGETSVDWEVATTIIKAVIVGFVEGVTIVIGILAEVFAGLVTGLATGAANIKILWEELKTKAQEMTDGIIEFITDLKDEAGRKWNEIKTKAIATWNELKTAIKEKVQEIYDSVTTKIQELIDWFITTSTAFVDAGKAIVQGIIDGIGEMWEALEEKITAMADAIIKWFKRAFGIDSPSAIAAEIGKNVVEGFIMGVEEMARVAVPDIPVSLAPMGGALLAMSGTSPTAALASFAPQPVMSQSVQVPIGPVYISSGMDEAAFQVRVEQAVMRALGR